MIVWRGWGVLALLIGGLGGGLGTGLGVALGGARDRANYGTVTGLLLAAVAIWFVGSALNKPKPGYHPATGQPVLFRNQHSLFFVPMQFWGPIACVVGLGLLVSVLLDAG